MKAFAIILLVAVKVGPGTYRPIFPASPAEKEVPVDAFLLDKTPVTNAQYLAFVSEHPEWRRDRIKPLLADENYLATWRSADSLGMARPGAPVVRVSWFAARAYCAAQGGRLPLEREWELAAGASEKKHDATRDPAFQARVLAWYTQITPPVLPDVGGVPNAWGASDMHGLVWEWIEDFSASLVEADSRDPDRKVFCGGAGASSRDGNAYAAFMRIAFRSSLDARSTTGVLGFRCAYDLPRTK
ncbi:MAG TPA: formylglycine-generating enzyme family protein [Kofleriaceae bacterium]|jgi:sulfatase modifying factor 1|nr:formylglycine-generating enzyme family protein [Kofleriaceae bacterium]